MEFLIIQGCDINKVVKLPQVVVFGKVALPKSIQVQFGIIQSQREKLLVFKSVDDHLDEDQKGDSILIVMDIGPSCLLLELGLDQVHALPKHKGV